MTSGPEEHDTSEMDPKATAVMAKKYPDTIVGVTLGEGTRFARNDATHGQR